MRPFESLLPLLPSASSQHLRRRRRRREEEALDASVTSITSSLSPTLPAPTSARSRQRKDLLGAFRGDEELAEGEALLSHLFTEDSLDLENATAPHPTPVVFHSLPSSGLLHLSVRCFFEVLLGKPQPCCISFDNSASKSFLLAVSIGVDLKVACPSAR